MTKTIVLISGGNRGIGLEIVKALLESDVGYHVYMGSRDEEKGREIAASLLPAAKGNNTVEAIQLDVTSPESVAAAVSRVRAQSGRLDVLINNAGINEDDMADQAAKMRKIYDVNVISAWRMIDSFQELLLLTQPPPEGGKEEDEEEAGEKKKVTKRIVNVSSSMGSVAWKYDARSSVYDQPYTAYRCTKSALNMLTACTAYELRGRGVVVHAFNPGWAATGFGGQDPEMVREYGGVEPRVSGLACRDIVEGKRDQDADKMVDVSGDTVPW
ncbi:NAD(P)-binding protein [Xylariomycetidae sp. FL2044]|nr:NAD(P)-binding protein [Xylariomycetidae sp. FL2044]